MRAFAFAAAAAATVFRSAQAQPRRLRIVNGCKSDPIWIAHTAGATAGPDPQNLKIAPMEHHDFLTTDGLSATRYWPKMHCDADGNNCAIGESGGPGQGCVKGNDYSACAPPVDTKFEASFGVNGQPCNPAAPGGSQMKGCDYVDVSLVDGWTLPLTLDIKGQCTDSKTDKVVDLIDCSALSLDVCPGGELLAAAAGGAAPVDLRAKNPLTGSASGCFSPCQRLLDDKWIKQTPLPVEHPDVAPYCCPTPPVSPEQCRVGPIMSTAFLKVAKEKCPGAYTFAYDDSNGLLRCSSATRYVLTFLCPLSASATVQPGGDMSLMAAAAAAAAGNATSPGFLQKRP